MKIVSGKTGTPHVTSEQFRQIIEGTVGQGSYILTSGENLEPELASNNMLKIRGGMMSHHGNVSCVELNTYDEVTLTNGSQGVKRIDLVVNRYTRNDETGLEKNEWIVIIGTPDASSPKVPQHTIGNLQNGDLIDDCPVFEVHYDGINVTEVKKLLPVMSNLDLLNGKLYDTGWVNCKMGNGIVASGGETPSVRKIGNIVFLHGTVKNNTSWETHDNIITIPEGFRPNLNVICIQSAGGTHRYKLQIKTSGGCMAANFTNNEHGNYKIQTGTIINFCTSWLVE